MKINLSTLLAILGGLGVFAPDVAGIASWLAGMNIGWLSYVIRGLGLLSALFAAMPIVVPRLRACLALLGLATAPGARAPWSPGKDDVTPVVAPAAAAPDPLASGMRPGAGYPGKTLALLILAGSLVSSCAWWQKHEPQFDCAAIATVDDAPQLIAIVIQCEQIAVTPAALLPCIEGAAGSKWTQDILQCFAAAQQGKTTCPAYATAKAAWKGQK